MIISDEDVDDVSDEAKSLGLAPSSRDVEILKAALLWEPGVPIEISTSIECDGVEEFRPGGGRTRVGRWNHWSCGLDARCGDLHLEVRSRC